MLKCTEILVTIAAIEVEKLIEFYTQLFGQAPASYMPKTYAEFRLTGLRLGIFKPQERHIEEFENSAGSGMSLCLEVEDLQGAIAHLSAMGYPPSGNIEITSHGREIYAYDPAGNRLILHQIQ